MPPIRFACPACQTILAAAPTLAGHLSSCGQCGAPLTIPSPDVVPLAAMTVGGTDDILVGRTDDVAEPLIHRPATQSATLPIRVDVSRDMLHLVASLIMLPVGGACGLLVWVAVAVAAPQATPLVPLSLSVGVGLAMGIGVNVALRTLTKCKGEK